MAVKSWGASPRPPLNVTVGGRTFNGTDILQPTLNSLVFTNNDYTSTQFVSDPTVAKGFTTGEAFPPAIQATSSRTRRSAAFGYSKPSASATRVQLKMFKAQAQM